MLELLIAIRTGVCGDLLAVDPQRDIHLVEKTRDGIGRDWKIDLLQNFCDLLRRLPDPLQPWDGISLCRALEESRWHRLFRAFFFHGFAPAARSACAVHFHVLSQQLLSAAGHGVRSEVEKVGQLAIAAAAQLE